MKKLTLLVLACASASTLALTACDSAGNKPQAEAAKDQIGIDLAGMDKNVKPGDDFNAFVNGAWDKATEIPADKVSQGAFETVAVEVEKRNTALLADVLKSKAAAGSDERRIADYYNAYLNTDAIERAGLSPLTAPFAEIDKARDVRSLSTVLGSSVRADADPLNATNYYTPNIFGIFVSQALHDPNRSIAYLLQGGLGMPDREYYLSGNASMAANRTAYKQYLTDVGTALGWPDAAARAQRVIDLETKIARIHTEAAKAQDAKAAKEWTRAQFASDAPGLDWNAFFQAAGLGNQQSFIAWHTAPTRGLSQLVASEPLDAWKDLLKLHTVTAYSGVLPRKFDLLNYGFYGKQLSGQQQQRTRDKRALSSVSNALGDAVGKLYTDKYLPANAKADIGEMVDNIKAAFDKRLVEIDWLAPATKAEARNKLKTLLVEVGGPETRRNYSSFDVRADDAFGNAWRADLFEYRHQLAKLGKPVDRKEWWLLPHVVNAVFLPLQNAMNYPAAILEPPFYNASADAAFNYGSLGSVIGHEITHSFDNLGADFDSAGRVRNWWTPADFKRFEENGKTLIAQYDAYQAFPDLNLNGTLTLGENIADLAGLEAAYNAYRASLKGKQAPVINGLTGDQRFFIAYGQSRRGKFREAILRQYITGDSHAPGPWRAQTVRNLDAWYKAFNVQPGEKLYLAPDKRVKIW